MTAWQAAWMRLDAICMLNKPEPDAASMGLRPIADLRAALTFLTRLPVGGPHRGLDRCAWAFPLAGALVGALGGAVFWAAMWSGMGAWIGAFLALAVTAFLTGALHEDGLADAVDGLGAGGPVERKLEIMRDSRIGGYGALALVLATGLKAAALSSLYLGVLGFAALIAAHALARAILPGVMAMLKPASASGVAAASGKPSLFVASVAFLVGTGIACLALDWVLGAILGATALGVMLLGAAYLKSRLGGYNGDTIGLLEQVCEIVLLLAFVGTAHFFQGSIYWMTP